MREFFRGWKRKIGCLTLVMACFFAIAWFRAEVTSEFVLIKSGVEYTHILGSLNRSLVWAARKSFGSEPFYATLPASTGTLSGLRFLRRWHLLGFESAQGIVAQNGITITYWAIPFWSIIIPLTVISAVLLLSKPPKSTPKKFTEPTVIEEV